MNTEVRQGRVPEVLEVRLCTVLLRLYLSSSSLFEEAFPLHPVSETRIRLVETDQSNKPGGHNLQGLFQSKNIQTSN